MIPDPFSVPLERLRERTSAKWRHYEPDVLPLWVAEMDVDLADPIREALERAVRAGDMGYPGSTPYVDAFAGFAARQWGWEVDAARVTPVASVIDGYVDALVCLTDPGGEVIVNPPVYPPFFLYLRQAGREIREAPLGADLRLDLAAIERAMAEATSGGRRAAYLLCSPHNPGGTVHTREELTALAELSHRYGVPVVADEIHAPLVYSGSTFVPYLEVDPAGLALHAASKAWNLAATPAALLVGGPDATGLERYREGKHHGPTHLGTIAQTAAYAEGEPWLDALVASLDRNRVLLGDLIAAHLPSVGYPLPQGTYLAWLDFGQLLGDEPAYALIDHGRVALNNGPYFGTGGAGHARLNFATSPEILEEAVRRIVAGIARAQDAGLSQVSV